MTTFSGVARVSGQGVAAHVDEGGTSLRCKLYDGSYPGTDGETIVVSGTYQPGGSDGAERDRH